MDTSEFDNEIEQRRTDIGAESRREGVCDEDAEYG
jgi:hypothetical protein